MKRKTINICRSVDVDIDIDVDITDYTEAFLEECSDEEVISEAVARGLMSKHNLKIDMMSPYEFKRYLCDMLDFGYTVSDDTILAEIKSRIRK